MSGLTLTLLGPPHLDRDGEPVHLRSRKCLALLAYLAVTGRTHRRDSLASLLWPESDSTRAQNSLRYTLSLLRRALDGAWLVVDRETIGLDGSEGEAVDLVRFRYLLTQCETHGHAVSEACSQCLPLLEEAVDLVQGDFMAGFTLRDAPEFDDWQALVGEALQRELASALERLAEGYAAQGDVEKAIAHAQRWVGLYPLEEGAHRALMQLYAGSGRQSAALLQYDACRQALSEELGVSPGRETRELYEAIREGRVPQVQARAPIISAVPARPRHNLPVQPTPFVGREEELDQIAERLADPACRLLTVVGPGGMGKSRLAIQAAEEHLPLFGDGAWFIPLDSVGSVELLPSTIMEALDVPRFGGADPQVQLLNYLREKKLLLVLDGFQHLLEWGRSITEMIRSALGLKVLVTSRQRLNLREEWLLPLEGMKFPEDGQLSDVGEEDYSAIQLFAQCARRVQPDFSVAVAGAGSVARICQLVEGMPLAIELAAPWARAMRCQDIAQAIERDMGFLATTLRDMPARHRSMRAVFDRSWEMLSVEEREVLEQLWVFRGGFRWEAAAEVAVRPSRSHASLAILSSLVDRCWLRATPTGRYEIHELVRQYAAENLRCEKLDAEPSEERQTRSDQVRDRHSRYYAAFLQEREPGLFARRQKEAFEEILGEMDNVWAAWNWAVERGDVEAIGKCVRALEEVAELRGWRHEAHQAFDQAANMLREELAKRSRLEKDPTLAHMRIILAEALCSQAQECLALGLADQARALCEESLAHLCEIGRGLRERAVTARSMGLLGRAIKGLGDPSKGDQFIEEALPLYREANDARGMAAALIALAQTPHHLGQYDKAEQLALSSADIAGEAGDLRYRAWCLGHLAEILRDKGEYDSAREAAEEALQIRQELGDRVGIAHSHWTLAWIATGLGNHELARTHYRDGLALGQETGSQEAVAVSLCGLGAVASALGQYADAKRFLGDSLTKCAKTSGIEVHALLGLGHVACVQGDLERSRRYFDEALVVAMEAGRAVEAMEVLIGLAHLLSSESEREQAAELLSLALHHPATRHAARDKAQALLSELASELSAEAHAAATARGQSRQLDEVVAEILELR